MKSKYQVQPGDKIHIFDMDGEPHYAGREGIVRTIDSIGQVHGSWGGLALNFSDDWVIIEEVK